MLVRKGSNVSNCQGVSVTKRMEYRMKKIADCLSSGVLKQQRILQTDERIFN